MADSQGVSFIPKQPTKGGPRRRTIRKIYVLAYISFVLFIGTLIAAGGTFFYKTSVERELERQQAVLAEERDRFSQADIARLQELQRRLDEAEALMDNHISVTSIFTALEQVIVDDIVLNAATLKREDGKNIALAVTGAVVGGVDPVLFQRSVMAGNSLLREVEVTKPVSQALTDVDENGSAVTNADNIEAVVTFELSALLTPDEVPYIPPVIEVEPESDPASEPAATASGTPETDSETQI